MISRDRILRMTSVAEYMYRNAEKYNLDKDDMYILGFLHDIGYLQDSENHQEEGERIMHGAGMNSQKYTCFEYVIAHHNQIPDKSLPYIIYKMCLLLAEADMHINHEGECVPFKKRLDEIKGRHGETSERYLDAKELVSFLEANCKRQKGKWIRVDGVVTAGGEPYYECSICGKGGHCIGVEHLRSHPNVCPNCGADMRGDKHE